MHTDLYISNGKTKIKLIGFNQSTPLHVAFMNFITPVFSETMEVGDDVDLTIKFSSFKNLDHSHLASCTKKIVLRKSSAQPFNFDVISGFIAPNKLFAFDEARKTAYLIDQQSNIVDMYLSDLSFYHLIEFFRYYVLLTEQMKGTLILHAAAYYHPSQKQVYAICGQKGAGKTTTVLNRILRSNMEYFSGDKLLLNIKDNALVARAWPDYPHIGYGTLIRLKDLLPVEQLGLTEILKEKHACQDKFLIDFGKFKAVFVKHKKITALPIHDILLPQIQTNTDPLDQHTSTNMDNLLEKIIEWPDSFSVGTWHGMQPKKEMDARDLLPTYKSLLKKINFKPIYL